MMMLDCFVAVVLCLGELLLIGWCGCDCFVAAVLCLGERLLIGCCGCMIIVL